jgi:uncharacterized protein DUF2630
MDETQIHERIEQLVAEEHELYGRVGEGGLNADEHNRLESIKVSLDQCWDLLRQRVRFASRARTRTLLRCATPRSSNATSSSR